MQPLNILHIPSWYPNEDDVQLGVFIKKQILLLEEEPFHHTILYIQGRKESKVVKSSVKKEAENITLIHVTYPSGKNIFSRVRNYLNSVTTGLSSFLELNIAPDIIHCHVASRNLWIAKKFFPDTPCLLSEHWSGFLNGGFERLSFFKKYWLIKKINRCKKVLAVSEHLKIELEKKGVKVPIEVVGNVVSVPAQKEMISNQRYRLLVVADLDDDVKNISGIIDAFAIALKQKLELELTIIGGGKDETKLKQKVSDLSLGTKVKFEGRLSNKEVLKRYALHDCLIVNSLQETYSLVTAEALSCGIPVIATNCQGPQMFINSSNGVIIPKNNPEKLGEAIVYMVNNRLNYPPEKVRESVVDVVNNDKIKTRLIEIYKQLLLKQEKK